MLFIYYVTLLYGLISKLADSSRSFMKPHFPNYCEPRDQCKLACNCEVYPNCSLLQMDETVRKTILFYHNQIRDIQSAGEPQPAGMTMLQYDMQLEEISKCWAARCDNEYSECFKSSKFKETSQSVGGLILEGEESPNVFLWLQMMSYWLGQAEVVPPTAIHSLPADQKHESMHNFAQLMSDTVLSVGCAWSMLTTDNWLIFVCTYGPRGPRQGEQIYRTGFPCTHCPANYSCDYVKPFERLCKPNVEHHKPSLPHTSAKSVLKSAEKEPKRTTLNATKQYNIASDMPKFHKMEPTVARSHSFLQNSMLQKSQKDTKPPELTPSPVSYPNYKLSENPTMQFPRVVRIYPPQDFSQQTPAVPPLPKMYQDMANPSFMMPPHHQESTSPAPQQYPLYIPQPPPLPRIESFNAPVDQTTVQAYNTFPPPVQGYQFQSPPLVPPVLGENTQLYFPPKERQPILPPPPVGGNMESILKSQYSQAMMQSNYPKEYVPSSLGSNISPPIPQPPPIDSHIPQYAPGRQTIPVGSAPNMQDYGPPMYESQGRRIYRQDSEHELGHPEVELQSSELESLQNQGQHNRQIVLPHAEPLPPPLSYFPPQPPPLPRESGVSSMKLRDLPQRMDSGDDPSKEPEVLYSDPDSIILKESPSMEQESYARPNPAPSQYSYTVRPFEIPKDLQGESTKPPLELSSSSALHIEKTEEIKEYRKPFSSNGFFEKGFFTIILSDIFVVLIFQ